MKITVDTDRSKLIIENESMTVKEMELYSKEAFEVISNQWVKVGWNEKHIYTFSWLGRPIIQLPQDMIRIQEVIYKLKPDIIIETGVAHGGSLVFYASICKAMGRGRVIGVDIEIRPHNRKAIENHELYPLITLIEGSSIDTKTFELVKKEICKDEKVMVILDSCHTKQHVYRELELYSKLVSKNSYIVVEDGIMEELWDVPRGVGEWKDDNPSRAALDFVKENGSFIFDEPEWVFNESKLDKAITHWSNPWIKRIE